MEKRLKKEEKSILTRCDSSCLQQMSNIWQVLIYRSCVILTTLILDLPTSCNTIGATSHDGRIQDIYKAIRSRNYSPAQASGADMFDATISGKEEDYTRAADLAMQLSKVFTSKENAKYHAA